MDLTSILIWTTITAIITLIAKALFGFDLKKFLGELTIIILGIPVAVFVITSPHDVAATTSFLNWYINEFANMLPGMVIGEFVGNIIAVMTKISKQF